MLGRVAIESYPNREIRVVLSRSRGPRVRDIYAGEEKDDLGADISGIPTCHSLNSSEVGSQKGLQDSKEGRKRVGYGELPTFRRFTTYARRKILRAGGALERVAPHDRCLFMTVTLPGGTREALEALARYSAKAVAMLKDWVSNYVASNLSIYTWEWQKRGALHLHYVIYCPDVERGEWLIENLQKQWIRILDKISLLSRVDLYKKNQGFSWTSDKTVTRVDAQWCRKSVAAYLSKYVSKATASAANSAKGLFAPSRWYGVSRCLHQVLNSLTVKAVIDNLRMGQAWADYESCLSVLESTAIRCYEYEHDVGGGKTVVAYVDQVEQEPIWRQIMDHLIQPQDSSASIESRLRIMCKNGVLLMRRHKRWSSTFASFCANSRPSQIINLPSYRDISRADLVYILDMLTYTFRYTQRTQWELPGECQLWYASLRKLSETATPADMEWMGNLDL